MPSIQAPDTSGRAARLRKLFHETVSGRRPVQSPQTAQLFLEAARGQPSPVQCVQNLISSASGLGAFSAAIRCDLSTPFLLSHTLPFLKYLADPGVKALADGQLLEQLLLIVARPPIVLNALMNLFEAGQIPDESLYAFGWLALTLAVL